MGTGKAPTGGEPVHIEVHPLRVPAGTWGDLGHRGGVGEGRSGKRIGGIVGKATKEKKRQSYKVDHGAGQRLRSEQWKGYIHQSASGEESRKGREGSWPPSPGSKREAARWAEAQAEHRVDREK